MRGRGRLKTPDVSEVGVGEESGTDLIKLTAIGALCRGKVVLAVGVPEF